MLLITAVVAGVLGLLIGSFLNVVIHRVPAGLSLVRPASRCPSCEAPIRWYDNIPIVSWLVLRGRCRDCGAPISARYPIVETLTGVAFVLVACCFAPGGWLGGGGDVVAQTIVLVAYLWFAAASIALAAIDFDVRRLPDPIVWTTLAVLVVCFAVAAALRADLMAIATAVLGGIAMFAVYVVILLVAPRGGMGLGDVKLAAAIGVATGWIGWSAVAIGWFAAFLIGALVGIGLLAVRRTGRRTAIPFGPWMLAGAWIGIIAGPAIWAGYAGLVGWPEGGSIG